jgi:hypothetical protein
MRWSKHRWSPHICTSKIFANNRGQELSYVKLLHSEGAPNAERSPNGTWPRFRNCLRLLRLQCIGVIFQNSTRWKSSTEHRKVAMYHSRQIVTSHVLLHILPLSAAATLWALQWTKYWIGMQTNVSTPLQFAAKFHELTMQASLVEVLLCAIRTEVVAGYVPLAALSGITQPTQLSYLWSIDFLSLFASPALRGWKRVALLFIIPFLLLLISFVGPSSAILVIPRPDTPEIVEEITTYLRKSVEEIFPSTLSKADGLNVYVLKPLRAAEAKSLRRDIQEFNSTVRGSSQWLSADSDGKTEVYKCILSHSCPFTSTCLVLFSTSESDEGSDAEWREKGALTHVATAPSCFCVNAYAYGRLHGAGKNRTTIFTTTHPVVSTRCTSNQWLKMSTNKSLTDSSYDANVFYLKVDGMSIGLLFDYRTLVDRVSD